VYGPQHVDIPTNDRKLLGWTTCYSRSRP